MRFFWINKKSLKGVLAKYLIWTGPRLCPKISQKPEQKICYKKQQKSPCLKSRTERNAFLFSSFHGSITVEATCVLPLFLFFCIQLVSIIYLFQLHSAITAALHQEVSAFSLQMYAYEQAGVTQESISVDLLSDVYLKKRVIHRVGEDYLNRSMIEGGSTGISVFLDKTFEILESNGQDEIDVTLTYRIKPMVGIFGFSGFTMKNRCRMKAWTGYRLPMSESEKSLEEELVYVTENGSVYHKSRQCSHLALSVREIERDSLSVLRNESGEKYYPCEMCGTGNQKQVFLSDWGNRYHTSLTCGGLKRTVYVIRISEIGGKGACSKCAGIG